MQQHFCKTRHKEITLRAAHKTLGKEDFTGIVLQVFTYVSIIECNTFKH